MRELIERLIALVEPTEETSALINEVLAELTAIEEKETTRENDYEVLLEQFNEVSSKLATTREEMRRLFTESFKENKTKEEELEEVSYDDLLEGE